MFSLLAHANPTLLLVVPPCLGLAFLGYRSYLRTIQERAIWQHLEATSQEINRLDEAEIADVALARVLALLEADEVELCLFPSDGTGTERVYIRTATAERQRDLVRGTPTRRPSARVADRRLEAIGRHVHRGPARRRTKRRSVSSACASTRT